MSKPFHDGGRHDIETSPLICKTNQWTGFYMILASDMKGLNKNENHAPILLNNTHLLCHWKLFFISVSFFLYILITIFYAVDTFLLFM